MRPAVLAVLLLLLAVMPGAGAYKETDHEDSALSTHQFLMDRIPAIWENDGHAELAAWLRDGRLSDLKQGTIHADATLWDSREHYMDPDTHGGLLFFTAAGDRAESEFALAADAWRQGDDATAVLHLGWAMHLVQDLTVPHHARRTFLDSHAEYEDWVLAHQLELPVALTATYDLPPGPPGHPRSASRPFDWVDNAAHTSWSLFGRVDGADGTGDNDYRQVAAQMVPLAEQISAGFLYRMLERLNGPPVADAGPDASLRIGATLTLDGAGSSDDLLIREFDWELPTGRTTGVTTTFTPNAEGETTISLTVTDVFGETGTDSLRVAARPVPALDVPPLVSGRIGVPIEIVAGLTTGETPAGVEWVAPTWRATGAILNRTFDAPGETRVDVAATLDDGLVVRGTVLVRIEDDVLPVAEFTAPERAFVGDAIPFDASGSTDNVGIVAYVWRFGDGAVAVGGNVTHAFADPGEYEVTLEVRDAAGNLGTATRVVRIVARPSAPPATAVIPPSLAAAVLGAVALTGWAAYRRRRKRKPDPDASGGSPARQTDGPVR